MSTYFSPLASEDDRDAALDAYEDDQRDDRMRKTPLATVHLLGLLWAHGVTAYVTGTGGGCEAVEIPLSPRNAEGFADEILVTAREDAVLPYLGSGVGATFYRAEDEGDPYDFADYLVTDTDDLAAGFLEILSRVLNYKADKATRP